ncbi:carcinoembryonic antigen-related cell adhesion molecule 5-like isoform X6 [Hemibagrus wyckioides]|uniref:carcinoembryonic antigen-related cell adhesion molecule 5-like isoform X6 n=1 Tax=Hemibagrus wyckioides TaxID=337641 RepID=UPI00266BB302|nr:carcinoembryonic antigen-related cell adhesion molecule 5-like isoform X6 [Hemibagrus wyckioides]
MELSPLSVILLLISLIPVSQAQGSPKAVVSIKPDTHVFIGETVTLRCDIQGGGDTQWTYSWMKNNYGLYIDGSKRAYAMQEFIIWSVEDSDSGTYTCTGHGRYSQISGSVTLTVSVKPKPTVRVNPQSSVYTGDTVTLSCELQSTGWEFQWYKNNQSQNLYSEEENTLKVTVDNAGETEYKCRARRRNYYYYNDHYYDYYDTEYSDPVKITVRETGKPKPTVRVNPQSSVYTGDTVTLSCELQQGTGWRIYWYKNNQLLNLNSEQVKTLELTVNNAGEIEYKCWANRINYNYYYYYTEFSDPIKITVRGKPKPTVRVNPQSSVYTGDTVTLSCELQQETGWRIYWYKNNQLLNLNSEQVKTLKVTVNNAGETEYKCWANRINNNVYYYFTEFSDPIKITVRGESPPVSLIFNPSNTQHFTNDSLSLSCEDQSNSAGWTVRRYTHSERVLDCSHWGSVTGSTCNISFLSTSYTGVYWCESESGENSNPVNITVHGSRPGGGSSGRTAGLVVGLGFLFIALLILMILLWSYKRKKEKLQTSAEDSQSGHTPLQAGSANVYATVDELDMAGTGEAAAEISEATYAQVTEKMKTNRNNGADADVTYAEIQLKPMMETKRKKEMASVDDSAVYSEVRKDVQ